MKRGRACGKVYLAGAGPGDPGLITVRALEHIKRADAVIYDRLASKDILKFCKAGCLVKCVGKRKGRAFDQNDINSLLLSLAEKGMAVVRLKGGDPFIFGRGYEEMKFLKANGVACEAIPGVSSFYSVPESVGIPLTCRDISSGFMVVTGHEDPAKDKDRVDWRQVAGFNGTVVVMMGLSNIGHITAQLVRFGMDRNAPAAVISCGTTNRQKAVFGKISDIAAKASALRAPAICVIGDVVNSVMPQSLEQKPLIKKRYLATASESLNRDIAASLKRYGASVECLPTVKIVPNKDTAILDGVVREAESYDWLVFSSRHGVRYFMERYLGSRRDTDALSGRVACVGSGTAAELKKYGVKADLMPSRFTTSDLARCLIKSGIRGSRIALLRTRVGTDLLKGPLVKAGATVTDCLSYFIEGSCDVGSIRKAFSRKHDGIFFLSPKSACVFFGSMAVEERRRRLGNIPVYSIGPVTTRALRKHGIRTVRSAKDHTVEGLVNLCLEESRRSRMLSGRG